MSHCVYYKDAEVALRYGITRVSVWRWVKTGRLPAPVRLSDRCTRWRIADLLAFEAERAAQGCAK